MKTDNSPVIFDRGQSTHTLKIVERPSAPEINYWVKKLRPKSYRNLATGEIVMRRRGGKGFERVYGPWSPEGLVRRNYPRGWAAQEPGPGPYEIRRAAELALLGADVGAWNIPGAAEYAAGALRANRLARDDVCGAGPKLDDLNLRSEPMLGTDRGRRELYRLELAEGKRKRDDWRRRVVSNDFRGDNREPGPVVTIKRDGQVAQSWTWAPHTTVAVHGVRDYTSNRKLLFKDGRRRKVPRQQSPQTNRPGRKPIGAVAMTSSERVRRHRRARQLRSFNAPERPQTAGWPLPRGLPAVDLSRKEGNT